jgi:hypothetical protein
MKRDTRFRLGDFAVARFVVIFLRLLSPAVTLVLLCSPESKLLTMAPGKCAGAENPEVRAACPPGRNEMTGLGQNGSRNQNYFDC